MKIYYFENRGFSIVFDSPDDGADLAAKASQNRCIRTKTYGPDQVVIQVAGAGRMVLHAWTTRGDVIGIWAVAATSARAAKSVMEATTRLLHFDGFEIVGDGEAVKPIDIELLSLLSTAVVPDSQPRYHTSRRSFDRSRRVMAATP